MCALLENRPRRPGALQVVADVARIGFRTPAPGGAPKPASTATLCLSAASSFAASGGFCDDVRSDQGRKISGWLHAALARAEQSSSPSPGRRRMVIRSVAAPAPAKAPSRATEQRRGPGPCGSRSSPALTPRHPDAAASVAKRAFSGAESRAVIEGSRDLVERQVMTNVASAAKRGHSAILPSIRFPTAKRTLRAASQVRSV